MNKIIELNPLTNIVLWQDGIVDLPTDVSVTFTSQALQLNTLLVTIVNGTKKNTYKLGSENRTIDLLPFLFEGAIQIDVDLISNGTRVHHWRVEDIIVRQIDNHTEIIPQIELLKQEMKKELDLLKSAIRELNKKLEE